MTQTEPEPIPLVSIPSEPAEPAEPQALDLRPDGTIAVWLPDGTEVVWRRPTLGEFRGWRLGLSQLTEANARAAMQAADAERADAADEKLTTEERTLRSEERRAEVDVAAEDRTIGWWAAVFKALADDPPDPDDWPPFMLFGTNTMSRCLVHWRAVPLAPGARSNRSRSSKK